MQCPSCRHDNRPGARLCDACGTPLTISPAKSASQVSVTASGNIDVGGRDKNVIQIVVNLLYAKSGSAPLPLAEALDRYLTHLIDSNKTLRLQGIRAGNQPFSVNLEKVYVSLNIRSAPGERRAQDKSSQQGALLPELDAGTQSVPQALKRHRRLVIVGDPGCGKTTLLAYLTLTYARSARDADDLVTVRLALSEAKHLPILPPLRYLGAHLHEKHPNPAADGPALLLDFLHTYYQNQSIAMPEGTLN